MRQMRLLKPTNIVIQKAVSSAELKKKYEIKVNRLGKDIKKHLLKLSDIVIQKAVSSTELKTK